MNQELFEWDQGNIEKVQKHGLRIDEIEELMLSGPDTFKDIRHSNEEMRFIALDHFRERVVLMVFVFRESLESTKLRIISARYASEKERKTYEEKLKSKKNN